MHTSVAILAQGRELSRSSPKTDQVRLPRHRATHISRVNFLGNPTPLISPAALDYTRDRDCHRGGELFPPGL